MVLVLPEGADIPAAGTCQTPGQSGQQEDTAGAVNLLIPVVPRGASGCSNGP